MVIDDRQGLARTLQDFTIALGMLLAALAIGLWDA